MHSCKFLILMNKGYCFAQNSLSGNLFASSLTRVKFNVLSTCRHLTIIKTVLHSETRAQTQCFGPKPSLRTTHIDHSAPLCLYFSSDLFPSLSPPPCFIVSIKRQGFCFPEVIVIFYFLKLSLLNGYKNKQQTACDLIEPLYSNHHLKKSSTETMSVQFNSGFIWENLGQTLQKLETVHSRPKIFNDPT